MENMTTKSKWNRLHPPEKWKKTISPSPTKDVPPVSTANHLEVTFQTIKKIVNSLKRRRYRTKSLNSAEYKSSKPDELEEYLLVLKANFQNKDLLKKKIISKRIATFFGTYARQSNRGKDKHGSTKDEYESEVAKKCAKNAPNRLHLNSPDHKFSKPTSNSLSQKFQDAPQFTHSARRHTDLCASKRFYKRLPYTKRNT